MNKEEFEKVKKKAVNGENPSGYIPVEYKLVLLNEFVDSKTEGGILEKTTDTVEKERRAQTVGYVVAVSEMAFTDGEGSRWHCPIPEVGDKVLFSKYAGQLHKKDGTVYRIVNDKDIVAIVKE